VFITHLIQTFSLIATLPPPPYPILSHLGGKKKVRRALVEAPENVATLVRVITSRLFNLVSDHTFPSAPPSYVPSFASSLIKGVGVAAEQRNATKEVLNCLRVLQRVLPVVFELESEPGVFEREVLWRRDVVVAAEEHGGQGQGRDQDSRHRERTEQTPQFVIEDDEDENDAENATPASSPQIPSSSSSSSPKQVTTTLPSVAERLFSCLVDLLFCCGFTLPAKLQVDHYKINHVIW
jgi:hypothetical protein